MTLATPEWRTLTGSTRRPVAVVADATSPLRALLAATAHQPLLLTDVDGAATTTPAEIAAPVFGRAGDVPLALSLTTSTDDPVPADQMHRLARMITEAADGLTTMVGGVRP